jgi:putative membrane protein
VYQTQTVYRTQAENLSDKIRYYFREVFMKRIILKWIVSAISIYIAGRLVPGFYVSGAMAAVVAAFVFAILNWTIKPLVTVLTLPVTVVTLGLFMFVINGIIVYFMASLLSGVAIAGLGTAILVSLVISLSTMVLNSLLGVNDK